MCVCWRLIIIEISDAVTNRSELHKPRTNAVRAGASYTHDTVHGVPPAVDQTCRYGAVDASETPETVTLSIHADATLLMTPVTTCAHGQRTKKHATPSSLFS